MILEALTVKKVTEAIPWKWAFIGVLALALVAGIWFAVHSYNSAIREANEAKASLKATQEELKKEQAKTQTLQKELADLKTYYAAREKRQAQAADRRTKILARKEKLDEKGAIAADDPTLLDLNSLFPGTDSNDKADAANTSGLPAATAGHVCSAG